MKKYSKEWFLAEAEKLPHLKMEIFHKHYNTSPYIEYVYFYIFRNNFRNYHNDSGPAIYNFLDKETNTILKEPKEKYIINGELIGENLKLYSKEELQNYLLLR